MFTKGAQEKETRRIERAVHDPHSAAERFDPEFVLSFQCSRCKRIDAAPRKLLRDAITTHVTEDCPVRDVASDEPIAIRIFYPKQ